VSKLFLWERRMPAGNLGQLYVILLVILHVILLCACPLAVACHLAILHPGLPRLGSSIGRGSTQLVILPGGLFRWRLTHEGSCQIFQVADVRSFTLLKTVLARGFARPIFSRKS
jgi:hypothetical protein